MSLCVIYFAAHCDMFIKTKDKCSYIAKSVYMDIHKNIGLLKNSKHQNDEKSSYTHMSDKT